MPILRFFALATRLAFQVVLVEEEANGGDGPARRPGMRGSSYKHLVGKAVAELDVGDCFGEISAMYRNKCEASIRAQMPLEVITIPRHVMMKCLHRSNPLMQKVLGLIRKRRKENDYFKLGKTSVRSTAAAMVAAHKLGAWIRKKMADKEATRKSRVDRSSGESNMSGLSAEGSNTAAAKPDLNA